MRARSSQLIRFGQTETGVLDIPIDVLREKHWAIRGPVGQRKTLFLLSALQQYISLPNNPVIFVDLGGDQVAYWLLKQAADKAGRPFYFFSLDEQHDSCSWDPIRGTPAYATDVTVAASGVASGLSLLHGEGYGRKFWGRLNQNTINEAFDALAMPAAQLPSFQQLVEELKRLARKARTSQNVSEAFLAADQLLRYSSLTQTKETVLNLGGAIEDSAVVVFHIPTALRGEASRAVASLLVWSVMVQAAHRSEQGLDPRYIQLAIDEYPTIAAAGGTVDSTLTLARKWNLHAWLIYQDDSQLITSDGDLRPIIRSQCQRVLFSCESADEVDELRQRSLDVLRSDTSRSLRGLSQSTSVREILEPRLTRNEIMQLSGIALKAYAVLRLSDQHRDPIPFTILPPTQSPAEHAKLKNKPLPKPAAADRQCTISQPARTPIPKPDMATQDRISQLAELGQQLRQEESWQLRSKPSSRHTGS